MSKDGTPLPVSVVIPAYNREDIIERALDSVAAQGPTRAAEIVVVDDASTDGTASVAERWGARVIRQEVNGGAAAARNAGIEAATQPWVALLDSDDEWLPHCLDVLWGLRGDNVVVSGANLGVGDTADGLSRYGGIVGRRHWRLRTPAALVYPVNFLVNSASLVRRDAVLVAGGYDTELRYSEDFDLWLRLLGRGTGLATDEVLTLYHHHAGQKTKSILPMLEMQQQIAWSYAAEPWWRRGLAENRRVTRLWGELRMGADAGSLASRAGRFGWVLRRPHRVRALVGIWAWRFLVRRRSSRLAPDGGPSIAAFPGGSHHESRVEGIGVRRRLGGRRLLTLARLVNRPAGLVLVERRADLRLVALTGCRAVRLRGERS